MSFFDTLEPVPDPKVSDTDRLCAEALRLGVIATFGVAEKWSKRNWSKSMSLLRRDIMLDEGRLGRVLDWFCKNMSQPYTPRVRSASTFRRKFLQIESAMKDDATIPQVKTELGEQVHYNVRHIGWPEHIKAHLCNIVELSIINLIAFREKVIEWRKRQTPQPPPSVREEKGRIIRTPQPQTAEQRQNYKMQDFATALIRMLKQPQHVLQDWLRYVNEKMQNGYGVHDERLNRFIWIHSTAHFRSLCDACIGPGIVPFLEGL